MLAHGLRGDLAASPAALEMLSPDDIETFGVDWGGLYDAEVRRSHLANNPVSEGVTTWQGRVGPPSLDTLSEVEVDPPVGVLDDVQVDALRRAISPTMGHFDEPTLVQRWVQGLAFSTAMYPNF